MILLSFRFSKIIENCNCSVALTKLYFVIPVNTASQVDSLVQGNDKKLHDFKSTETVTEN